MGKRIFSLVMVAFCGFSCSAAVEEGFIISPRNGESLRGVVVIVVSPPAGMIVDKVEIRLNGALKRVINAPGPYTYEWDTTTVGNGFYRITVDVYDIESYKKSETIEVQVIN